MLQQTGFEIDPLSGTLTHPKCSEVSDYGFASLKQTSYNIMAEKHNIEESRFYIKYHNNINFLMPFSSCKTLNRYCLYYSNILVYFLDIKSVNAYIL